MALDSVMVPPVGATTCMPEIDTRIPSNRSSCSRPPVGLKSALVKAIAAGSGLPVETWLTVGVPEISVWGGLFGSDEGLNSWTVPETLTMAPTAAAAGGVPLTGAQPLDGVNLLPYLESGAPGSPHEALFWKLAGYAAMRVGKWKLYLEPKAGIARLFDLDADPAEQHDLSATHPQVFRELMERYRAWDAGLPPRAWTNISPVFKK